MAIWIKTDGTARKVKPTGSEWTAKEIEEYTRGFFEIMPGIPETIYMNEMGPSLDLPFNDIATKRILKHLEGKQLRYIPQIFGDVLVMEPGEK